MLSYYIGVGLDKNIESFRRLARAVPEDALDVPTGEGRFTARQALAHWADWEPIHLSRIDAALAQDGANVPDYDEGARAISEGYDGWDRDKIVSTFEAGRRAFIDRLKSLDSEELDRKLTHSFFGTLTVHQYAGHVLGHDAYHVEQILGICPL